MGAFLLAHVVLLHGGAKPGFSHSQATAHKTLL
jgi:hypothetical protein